MEESICISCLHTHTYLHNIKFTYTLINRTPIPCYLDIILSICLIFCDLPGSFNGLFYRKLCARCAFLFVSVKTKRYFMFYFMYAFCFYILYFYRLFAALTLDIFSVGRKTKTYVTPPTCKDFYNKNIVTLWQYARTNITLYA